MQPTGGRANLSQAGGQLVCQLLKELGSPLENLQSARTLYQQDGKELLQGVLICEPAMADKPAWLPVVWLSLCSGLIS